MVETDRKRMETELEVMASIEIILLIAFSKHQNKLGQVLKLLQVLEIQASGASFLEQMEAKLNYIGEFSRPSLGH